MPDAPSACSVASIGTAARASKSSFAIHVPSAKKPTATAATVASPRAARRKVNRCVRRRSTGGDGFAQARRKLGQRRDGAEQRVHAFELAAQLAGHVVADELVEGRRVVAVGHSRTSSRSPARRARPARVRVFTVPRGTSR